MASSAPMSALRQLFENRFSQLSTEVESLFAERGDRDRRDFTEQLNQSVRRMRQAADSEELAATLVDALGPFSTAAAFFRIDGDAARGERIRGVAAESAESFPGKRIPLASAAALAGAMETRDPVTAVPSAAEVSPELVVIFGHSDGGRVTIFPIQIRDSVRALVYTSGNVEAAPAEMLCQVAAAIWGALDPVIVNVPAPTPELVQIAAPDVGVKKRERPAWENLPSEEQHLHLRAQRFARVQVADMRLHEGHAVQSGRSQRNLYGALQQRIDDARMVFRERFFTACPSMVDYLHVELVRSLAQEEAELLGKEYPGPLA